jgi:hypothetical protein
VVDQQRACLEKRRLYQLFFACKCPLLTKRTLHQPVASITIISIKSPSGFCAANQRRIGCSTRSAFNPAGEPSISAVGRSEFSTCSHNVSVRAAWWLAFERESRFVDMARAEIAGRDLGNVTMVHGLNIGLAKLLRSAEVRHVARRTAADASTVCRPNASLITSSLNAQSR